MSEFTESPEKCSRPFVLEILDTLLLVPIFVVHLILTGEASNLEKSRVRATQLVDETLLLKNFTSENLTAALRARFTKFVDDNENFLLALRLESVQKVLTEPWTTELKGKRSSILTEDNIESFKAKLPRFLLVLLEFLYGELTKRVGKAPEWIDLTDLLSPGNTKQSPKHGNQTPASPKHPAPQTTNPAVSDPRPEVDDPLASSEALPAMPPIKARTPPKNKVSDPRTSEALRATPPIKARTPPTIQVSDPRPTEALPATPPKKARTPTKNTASDPRPTEALPATPPKKARTPTKNTISDPRATDALPATPPRTRTPSKNKTTGPRSPRRTKSTEKDVGPTVSETAPERTESVPVESPSKVSEPRPASPQKDLAPTLAEGPTIPEDSRELTPSLTTLTQTSSSETTPPTVSSSEPSVVESATPSVRESETPQSSPPTPPARTPDMDEWEDGLSGLNYDVGARLKAIGAAARKKAKKELLKNYPEKILYKDISALVNQDLDMETVRNVNFEADREAENAMHEEFE